MKFTWINGDFIKSSDAVVGVKDLAVQRGFGVFDFFRCKQGRPFLLPHYLDRFYSSAGGLNLKVPFTKDEFTDLIGLFIKENDLKEEGVKMILTGGYSPDSYTPIEPNLIINAHTIILPEPDRYQNGFRVMTHQYQRALPSLKSINYLQGIQLLPALVEHGYDDVLYHNNGIVTEFPRSNVFMVDQLNQLCTPSENILPGITRKAVLHLAEDHFRSCEREITLTELKEAKEVFLTSTTKLIMPVCEIDGQTIGTGKPGPVSRMLSQSMRELPADFEIPVATN